MFQKGIEIRGSQILISALFVTFFVLANLTVSSSMELEAKGNESEEFLIPPNEISRSKVIEVSKQCLKRSLYRDEYLINKYKVHYDRTSQVWGVQFRKKGRREDTCMYGAIIEKNTGAVMCQCLYGL